MEREVKFTFNEAPSMENFNGKFAEILALTAPGGYGLGEAASWNYYSNSEEITETGWYVCYSSKVPFGNSLVLHEERGSGCAVQIWYAHETNTEYGYNVVGRRSKDNGIWGEFEYDNPPMIPGVEYRTTERYFGKPVYRKLINVSGITADTNIRHTYSDDTNCSAISAEGTVGVASYSGGYVLTVPAREKTYDGSVADVSLHAAGNYIVVLTNRTDMADKSIDVLVRYIKNTD